MAILSDLNRYSEGNAFHKAAEELFVILSGEAMLRSSEGYQKLSQVDIIFFEAGSDGAHQLYNRYLHRLQEVTATVKEGTRMKQPWFGDRLFGIGALGLNFHPAVNL
jgi:hypothetical protein